MFLREFVQSLFYYYSSTNRHRHEILFSLFFSSISVFSWQIFNMVAHIRCRINVHSPANIVCTFYLMVHVTETKLNFMFSLKLNVWVPHLIVQLRLHAQHSSTYTHMLHMHSHMTFIWTTTTNDKNPFTAVSRCSLQFVWTSKLLRIANRWLVQIVDDDNNNNNN